MRVLFVIPGGVHIACGAVRVLQYLPFLDKNRMTYNVLSYQNNFSIALWKIEAALDVNDTISGIMVKTLRVFRGYFNRFYGYLLYLFVIFQAHKYDVVYFQRVIIGSFFLKAIKSRTKIVFDFDDAIFLEIPSEVNNILKEAAFVVAGNRYLAEYAEKHNNNVALIPSSVDVSRFNAHAKSDKNKISIGWIGSSSTLRYLEILFPVLHQLSKEGLDFDLIIAGTWEAGTVVSSLEAIVPVIEIPEYTSEDIPNILERMDIGVMPLFDTPWEKGKCAMKALLYMAAGIPVVSSPVGDIGEIIEEGVSGFLAENTGDWVNKLKTLILDPELRSLVGKAGRTIVEERFSTSVCFRKLNEEVFSRIIDTQHHR